MYELAGGATSCCYALRYCSCAPTAGVLSRLTSHEYGFTVGFYTNWHCIRSFGLTHVSVLNCASIRGVQYAHCFKAVSRTHGFLYGIMRIIHSVPCPLCRELVQYTCACADSSRAPRAAGCVRRPPNATLRVTTQPLRKHASARCRKRAHSDTRPTATRRPQAHNTTA